MKRGPWSHHASAQTSNQLRKPAQKHAQGEKTQTVIFPSRTSALTCTRYLLSELSSESSHFTVEVTFGFLHMLRVRPVHNLKVVLGLSPFWIRRVRVHGTTFRPKVYMYTSVYILALVRFKCEHCVPKSDLIRFEDCCTDGVKQQKALDGTGLL